MEDKPRVGVSACIIGELVRYTGTHAQDEMLMRDLAPHVDLIPMCPEVEAGLGAPRESLHLEGAPAAPRLVARGSGLDQTPRLRAWSRARARAIDDLRLDGFVLKKGSPSCGMERVRVYRKPDTRPTYDGIGVFARELMARFPTLAVEEEGRLHDAGLREHFVTRIFASARWRTFRETSPTLADLVAFHARNELLLLAHDEEGHDGLGRLLTKTASGAADETIARYGAGYLATLSHRPTREKHHVVLARLLQEMPQLANDEREDLAEVIEDHRRGILPLAVPARLLLHHARHANPWAAEQTWFEPWPHEIVLRTSITHERPPATHSATPPDGAARG